MSSRDHAAAAAIARVVVACDGAILGIALAICAASSWIKYIVSTSSLHRIRAAPSVRISELRSLLSASDRDPEERLVVVRGQVQPKASVDSNWSALKGNNALISQGSGHRAVIVQQTQTCLYNEWRGIFGWSIDLHALFAKSWREQRSSSLKSVPFILVEGGRWPNSGYAHINLDGSTHPLPLDTVYHQLRPIHPTPYTFIQAIFGNGYPVALLDEEKILVIGKEITAVGMCKSQQDGSLEIKSCSDLPFFLSDMTKEEIEARLAENSRILFWSGVIFGAFSIGILTFAVIRNWRRWREWRQRRRSRDRHTTSVGSTAADESGDASDEGDVPEGQLCVICLMRRKRSAFAPCGHLVCCVECAMYVQNSAAPKCPLCRQSIYSSIRIYDS